MAKAADCTKKKRWYRSALEEAYQLYRCSAEQRLEVCCLSKPNRAKTDTKAAVVTKKGMQVSKINTEKKRPRVRKRKRDAALKCSVEIFCSDEALSKENMVVSETEGLLKELEKMLQQIQEPTAREDESQGEQMSHGFITLMTSCSLDLVSQKQQLLASVFQRVRQKLLRDFRAF